jgi:hypothetical protein
LQHYHLNYDFGIELSLMEKDTKELNKIVSDR